MKLKEFKIRSYFVLLIQIEEARVWWGKRVNWNSVRLTRMIPGVLVYYFVATETLQTPCKVMVKFHRGGASG